MLQRHTESRHLLEGQILALLVAPPQGASDWSSGNYENNCVWTAMYLAAQSWKYAVTRDPQAKTQADQSAEALFFLHDMVPQPGICARGWKYNQESSWDEDFFWKIGPMSGRAGHEEWHNQGNRRWVGDFSTDQLCDMFFGLCVYADVAADEQQQRRVGEQLALIANRVIDWSMRIVDVDGQPTTWGNMCPYVLEQELKALVALAMLKGAFRWSGDARLEETHRWLCDDHQYDRLAGQADPEPDPYLNNHSDDHMAAASFYVVLSYDDSKKRIEIYRQGFKRIAKRTQLEGNAMVSILYHHLCGVDFSDDLAIQTLRDFSTDTTMRETLGSVGGDIDTSRAWIDYLRWTQYPLPVPQWKRPRKEYEWAGNPYRIDGHYGMGGGALGESSVSGADYLFAYWLGRFAGYINENE